MSRRRGRGSGLAITHARLTSASSGTGQQRASPAAGRPLKLHVRHVKIAKAIALLFVTALLCGSGWNDYALDIGGGYQIVRANSFDVSLCNDRREVIGPWSYRGIGPLYEYSQVEGYIFTKHYGATTRDEPGAAAGWSIRDLDRSTTHYFLLRKSDGYIDGPLTKEQFDQNLKSLNLVVNKWNTPRNPNILLPLIGSLWFIVVSIPFLVIKYPFYALFVFLGLASMATMLSVFVYWIIRRNTA